MIRIKTGNNILLLKTDGAILLLLLQVKLKSEAMSNRVTSLFNIKYPIIQGGMVWCSGWRLAVAVSEAGGLGLIGAGSLHPEMLREHIQTAHLVAAGGPYASAQDIAIALRVDEIDCGIATESAARVNGLDFVPLTDECFDLVMRRGSYFEPGPQKLMAYIRGTQFTRQANALSGYDISHAGLVRLNK